VGISDGSVMAVLDVGMIMSRSVDTELDPTA